MPEIDAVNIHRNPAALKGTRLLVEEAPEWVVRRKVRNGEREDGHPVTILLLDRQIFPDELSRYTRYVRRLETPQAVQDAGKIELDFDPSTQKLIIHAVSIFRNKELTNHADLEGVDVIQRERDLEQGIYAGSITALILLKDVRTGDLIDIEYSIVSDDAIFPTHYWLSEDFEHGLPVTKQYFSWLSRKQERFQVSDDTEAEKSDEETEWGIRRTWFREDAKATDVPEVLPLGYNPFKSLSISSFHDWKEVAAEFVSLWESKQVPGDEFLGEISSLKRAHSGSDSELVEELVAFVRDNIRYQGVEIGRLGLVPDDIQVVWERRFGDCKEKTNILCWALNFCGFQATPALVSTGLRGRVSEFLPAPVFDHVVVHLRYEEKDYWVDPTVISQRGTLEKWNSLPFEKALLISPETYGFYEIASSPVKQDFLKVHEEYRFVGNDAEITVVHEFHGAEADAVRHGLDSKGRTAGQQFITDVVKSTRPKAELTTDLDVSDDPVNNVLTLKASFKAPGTLDIGNQSARKMCEFVPHSIIGKIVGLDEKPRAHPLGLFHPLEVYHSTRVHHPDAKGAIVPKTIIDNSFLSFQAGTRNEATEPEIFYSYRTKGPEVKTEDLERYRLNLQQISSVISLIFETRSVGAKPSRRREVGSWEDEELGTTRPSRSSRRVYQEPAHHSSTVPIWLIMVGIAIVIKIITFVMRMG